MSFCVVVLSPSCPLVLSPQHFAEGPANSAQVWLLPAHPKLYTLTPLPGTRLYADFAASWRIDRDRRNPSLAEFHPLSDEVYELLRRCPYLAIPFGYFEDPEHEAKEALLASGLERASAKRKAGQA